MASFGLETLKNAFNLGYLKLQYRNIILISVVFIEERRYYQKMNLFDIYFVYNGHIWPKISFFGQFSEFFFFNF